MREAGRESQRYSEEKCAKLGGGAIDGTQELALADGPGTLHQQQQFQVHGCGDIGD